MVGGSFSIGMKNKARKYEIMAITYPQIGEEQNEKADIKKMGGISIDAGDALLHGAGRGLCGGSR